MKMKPRAGAFLLISAVALGLCGCKDKEPPPEHHKVTRPKLPETGIRK